MKSIKKRLAVLLMSAMVISVMLVSASASGGDTSTSTSGTSATVISAFQTGFQKMASDAMSMIAIIVPIAVGVAGVIWLARKAMSWFKSMGQ